MKVGVWHQYGRPLKVISFSVLVLILAVVSFLPIVKADNPPPQAGSIGLEGTISSTPPTQGATVAVPGNGAVFTSIPITVSGLCPSGLLVKIFDNGVFVGSALCTKGSYTLQIDLFSGQNNLVAEDYDALGQSGPNSSTTTVTFNNAQSLQLGTSLSLSSDYAENGAPPGTEITWPIQLNGGTGPFAISVDWGDGSPPDLQSVISDGTITLRHVYKVAGVYTVIIKAVDKNGEAAFLQLVGQATGATQNNTKTSGNTVIIEKESAPWWPALLMLLLIFIAFWSGRKYESRALSEHYRE